MNCERCGKEHDGTYGTGRFCSRSCANARRHSEETKNKIRAGFNRWKDANPEKFLENCRRGARLCREVLSTYSKQRHEDSIKRLLDTSNETLSRDRLRLKLLITRGGKCERCGISEWMGSPISLEVDHKDGDHYNNSDENLVLLCPNCHSQTPTFRGRNHRRHITTRFESLPHDDIREMLKTHSINQVLTKYKLPVSGYWYKQIGKLVGPPGVEPESAN